MENTKNTSLEKHQAEMTRDIPVFTPSTDIYELGDKIHIVCDLPGVAEKDLDISLEESVLSIVGPQAEQAPGGHRLIGRGYATGVFKRSFSLMTDINPESVKAKLADGVLRIEIEKAERAKPRRIAVNAA